MKLHLIGVRPVSPYCTSSFSLARNKLEEQLETGTLYLPTYLSCRLLLLLQGFTKLERAEGQKQQLGKVN
jgi:hypothetical protein